MKIWQEFYCGECKGYFRVKLNTAINMAVEMVCPNCGHEHHRYIKDGVIYENGRYGNEPKEKIYPPKSAYSKEAFTQKMAQSKWARDGVVIKNEDDLNKENAAASAMIKERWFEIHGGKI